MRPPSTLMRAIAAAGVLALIATACGGDDEPGAASPSPAPASPTGQDIPTELSGLEIIDDLTFEVTLSEADATFVEQLVYPGYFPLPEVFYDDAAAFDEQPIGNGPFQLDAPWDHDVEIATSAYDDYAGDDPPAAPGIRFQIYADDSTAYNDLLAGNLDVHDELPAEQVADAQQRFGERFGESPDTSVNYLGFPFYVDFLADNPDLRAALSMAIDRELITSTVLDGTRDPANSFVAPGLPGHRAEVCPNWNHDPAGAQARFEQAGGLEALPETLTVWFNTGSIHEVWVEAVANQWNQVLGIPIERVAFEGLEFSEYLPLLDEQGLDGPFRLGWGMDYPNPQNFLEPLFATASHPPAGSNNTFMSSDEFDAKLAEAKQANATGGIDEAVPLYQEAEDIVCDLTAVAPMFFGRNQFAWNDTVSNVYVDAFGDINYTQIEADDTFSTFIVEPEHLTPTNSNESEGIAVLKAVFKGLVDYDPRTTETRLQVAESIESEDGGKTWTVTLEDGWTFHNGEPVTAASFVDAWNYAAYGPNGQANNSFFANIEGYDAMNPAGEE